jgi:hypothetical protein
VEHGEVFPDLIKCIIKSTQNVDFRS